MARELRAMLLWGRGLQTTLRAPSLAGVRRGERGAGAQKRRSRRCALLTVGGRTAPGLPRWDRDVRSLLGRRIAGSPSLVSQSLAILIGFRNQDPSSRVRCTQLCTRLIPAELKSWSRNCEKQWSPRTSEAGELPVVGPCIPRACN